MKNSKWIIGIVATVSVLALGGLLLIVANWYSPTAEAQSIDLAAPPALEVSPAVPAQQTGAALARTITVVGNGTVRIKPDIAQTNIGVEVIGNTVSEASSQAEDTMNKVMDAIKAQGVADKDIQTSGYNVWVERPYGPEGPSPDTQSLYHVSNTVSVTVRNLDDLSKVLDAAIEAGANNIFGVNFSVADPAPLQDQAREKAVLDAQSRAAELAKLNNVQVGQVISVSEVIGGGSMPAAYPAAAAVPAGMGGGGGPISPGELEIAVQLQITYAIE
jgi:uncharacterized protein YggE